jgi:hypothetical protein
MYPQLVIFHVDPKRAYYGRVRMDNLSVVSGGAMAAQSRPPKTIHMKLVFQHTDLRLDQTNSCLSVC